MIDYDRLLYFESKKMCSYRFDNEFIRLLEALTGLERKSKTQITQKAVMNYIAEKMDLLV